MNMSIWKMSGFDQLSQGTLGDGGANLYVSKKGVLQRIWRFDTTNSGYADIPITNSHEFNEHPMLHILHDPAGEARLQEVLTQGAQGGAVCDFNGDGYDDLIIGSCHDGHQTDLASYVYFGGEDGITENRKLDLAAPACTGVAAGDFNGDGKQEIAYLVADGKDASSPDLFNHRLRVYHQTELGLQRDGFTDLPVELTHLCAGDIDGDGCCDLYCRTAQGGWLILWGGPEGFSLENSLEVGAPTDDEPFNQLPFGGGNVRYIEHARPKILELEGKVYVLYCTPTEAKLLCYHGRVPSGEIVLKVPAVLSAAAGSIQGSGKTDLVVLTSPDPEHQEALLFFGASGYETPACRLPVKTPRDVLICDFSGNGYGDIAVCQGRDEVRFTTESLLFLTGPEGVSPTPRRFVTHNAVEVLAADFAGTGKKQLVFVNQQESNSYGHPSAYIYLGGPEGYQPERRLEFAGHSPSTMLLTDFNDDGWPDVLLVNNAEDQPQLDPPSYLFWGGPEGFSEARRTDVPTKLSWGAQVADLNRDGYLDVIATCGNHIRVLYGGENGYSEDRMAVLQMEEPEKPCGTLWPALADLNGDGWLDLVVPLSWRDYSLILWGGPEGYSMERSTKLPIEDAVTVRVADLNNNGYPDMVFGCRASYLRNYYHEGSVMIFWGGPDGYSCYNCCELPSYQSNCITIGDFNNDGYLDIFASSYFNKKERDINSFLYWNDHGHFSVTNRQRFFAHSSSAALAGDFNEDGYVDLVVSHHRAYGNHRTQSAIWWNGPEGFREENRTWLPSLGPHDMVATDIGNVLTRGPEEFYVTPVGELDGPVRRVSWAGEIPKKTWVNAQIRTAKTREALERAPWVGADGSPNSRIECGQELPASLSAGPLVQCKLYLGAVNSGNTPRLTEITVEA